MDVKIAEYRNAVDHLFRVINVDYCACVGPKEKAAWFELAQRVYARVEGLTCRRAKPDDLQSHAKALEAARTRFATYTASL